MSPQRSYISSCWGPRKPQTDRLRLTAAVQLGWLIRRLAYFVSPVLGAAWLGTFPLRCSSGGWDPEATGGSPEALGRLNGCPPKLVTRLQPSGGFGRAPSMSSQILVGPGIETSQPQRTAADGSSQPCRACPIRKDDVHACRTDTCC